MEVTQQLKEKRFYEPLIEPKHLHSKTTVNGLIEKGLKTGLIYKKPAD